MPKSSFRHSVLTLDPINPIALNLKPILIPELPISILPIVLPLPFPSPSIPIVVLALTVLFAFFESTNILCFLLNVLDFTLVTLELTVLEIPLVDALFSCVGFDDVHKAESLYAVVQERALVDEVALGCCEFALTLLAALDEFAFVVASVGEFVEPFTVGKIFEPLAMVV